MMRMLVGVAFSDADWEVTVVQEASRRPVQIGEAGRSARPDGHLPVFPAGLRTFYCAATELEEGATT